MASIKPWRIGWNKRWYSDFSAKWRHINEQTGLQKAACSPSFLSQIELDRASPTAKNLEKICRALDLTIADFLREDPMVNPPAAG
ncbi:MAG: helix-turn-helix transcriptional regulator [Verrucomicrobia bacterium]|nr:helix-turn-helix transcriptional regulator [Verrucomicrobiota bacterium]